MEKKILVLFFCILVISLISINLISAKEGAGENFKNFFKDAFEKWKSGGKKIGDTDLGVIKILLAIMITLLVFSILDTLGLISNKPALFVIAIIVGILSTYFMTITEIKFFSNIYTALGGSLVTLVPFLILGAFTVRAVIDGNVQLMIIQHIAWGIFTLFIAYTIISQSILDEKIFDNILFYGVGLISLALTIFNGSFLDKFGSIVLRSRAVRGDRTMNDIERGIDLFRRGGESTTDTR